MATASLMATTPTIKTITGTMINMTTVISSNMGAKDTTMNLATTMPMPRTPIIMMAATTKATKDIKMTTTMVNTMTGALQASPSTKVNAQDAVAMILRKTPKHSATSP